MPGENKIKTYNKVQDFLNKYKQIALCDIKDLPADMVHKMRKIFRDMNSEIVCGKTVIFIYNSSPILDCHH